MEEVAPHPRPLSADERAPRDEAAGGGPRPHHDAPAPGVLCVGEGVLYDGYGFEGAAHGSCS